MKMIVMAAALAAVAGPALAVQANWVSEVEIPAPDNRVMLRVTVDGDLGAKSVVVSDLAGINCGPHQYRYTQGENRQCWLWVRRGRTVTLQAKGMVGAQGADWTVEWRGCEVISNGAACRIAPDQDEVVVAAVLHGRPQ